MPHKKVKVLINNDIDRSSWNKLLSESPFNSPFQSPEFYDLFNSVSKLSAIAIAIESSTEIKALCVCTIQREHGLSKLFKFRLVVSCYLVFYIISLFKQSNDLITL